MKKSSNRSLKKGLQIYLSSIKTKVAIEFLKKKTFVFGRNRPGRERVNVIALFLFLLHVI